MNASTECMTTTPTSPAPAMNGGSVSSTSCNSIVSADGEELADFDTALSLRDNTMSRKTNKNNIRAVAVTQRKARRVRFYRNGDKFFSGIVIPVMPERYRSFDSLTTDLTRTLVEHVNLPSGVRAIYNMDGRKVCSLEELEDGKAYVCLGKGETFKRLEYTNISTLKKPSSARSARTNVAPTTTAPSAPRISQPADCVRPRIVTLIRNGIKPRRVLRLLLNKRNAATLEQAFESLTDAVRLDSGAVRRVFTLAGTLVQTLAQFFDTDDVFFVYGNERVGPDDFELEFDESRAIQQYKRTPVPRHRWDTRPKMTTAKKKTSTNTTPTAGGSEVQLPAVLKAKYSVGRLIGDGNFAVVFMCQDRRTGTQQALKLIDKSKCRGKEDMVENEVRVLRRVDHPNIIQLLDEHHTDELLYLVVELVPGGDLFDAITAAHTFSEEQAALMLTHLVSALAYLHSLKIVHRDVKPENLLVDYEQEPRASRIRCLKLADFGLACEVTGPLYTVCGTPTYVAPEILAETGYELKIDVWAAGVILYILLCGFPPFFVVDNNQERLFDAILLGQYEFPDEYWSHVSPLAKELIQHMLQLQPSLRFSAEDVLDHLWLATRCNSTSSSSVPTYNNSTSFDDGTTPIRVSSA